MDESIVKLIEEGTLETEKLLSEDEKKAAINILSMLDGHLIIRAEKILGFCQKAIKYKKYLDFNKYRG